MLLYSVPIVLMFSLLFMFLTHPLAVGLVLLLQTILVSVLAGLFSSSYWFSYILFLIFLGGMLVLFIYVASLASNEQFKADKKFILFFGLTVGTVPMFIFLDPLLLSSDINFLGATISKYEHNINLSSMMTSIIYDLPTAAFTLFIVSYLLLTLFVVVNLMISSNLPIRSKI
uniref:NADH dehydrogenase subunit 6 n=1 Tax=Dardanus arrosor TaxID=1070701 RepID=UPI001EE0278F|nr:NADH dehydrogenase subunit 6 [Dardanus arrosor]UIR97907.1 NADH dehydrogenase subunit 6 [Dardanus arrosor]